jgi:hypothetical protein
MTPGEIPFATRALGAPAGWDGHRHGDCQVLPIRDRDGYMQSAWYPTEEEIALLVLGKPVVLTVWGTSHPPVSVNVEAT